MGGTGIARSFLLTLTRVRRRSGLGPRRAERTRPAGRLATAQGDAPATTLAARAERGVTATQWRESRRRLAVWRRRSDDARVTSWRKVAIWLAGIYVVFWIGGNYSFDYTHKCVRSHTEERVINSDGDTEQVTVCDYYSANAKRWTFGDPVRAVTSIWVTDWIDATLLLGFAAWIGFEFWRDRRHKEAIAAYLREQRHAYPLEDL
jgi:hypothetical protein